MPARKAPAKQSDILEKEANDMEKMMSMLRGQIEEERSKVRPSGTRWAAADISLKKIDRREVRNPSGKKATAPPPPTKERAAKAKTDHRQSPRTPQQAGDPPAPVPVQAPTSPPPAKPKPKGKIEVVVEPQGGKLWGNYCESSCQPDDAPSGGSLWGAHPDESEGARQFKEEVSRLRGEEQPRKADSAAVPVEQEELPPVGAGGALWGAPPDESKEQDKFKQVVAKFRGETVAPQSESFETESNATEAKPVDREKADPTAFTYFDMLVNKDVIDGTRVVDRKP